MAKAKAKTQLLAQEDKKQAAADITAEYIAKGLKCKDDRGKKKPVSDSPNPLFKEWRAKLAELRRPDGIE